MYLDHHLGIRFNCCGSSWLSLHPSFSLIVSTFPEHWQSPRHLQGSRQMASMSSAHEMPADEAGPLLHVPCVGFPTCTHLAYLRYANTCCPPAGQRPPQTLLSSWPPDVSHLASGNSAFLVCVPTVTAAWYILPCPGDMSWPVLSPDQFSVAGCPSTLIWWARGPGQPGIPAPHRLPFPASSAAWAPGLASYSSACCPGPSCTPFPAASLGAVHGPLRPPHIPELLWHFVDDVGLSQHPLTPRTQQAWCSGPTDLQNWIILNPEISISSKVLKSWC